MEIVKTIKDYKMNHEQQVFAGYLKSNLNSYSCSEMIANPNYIAEYLEPKDDFLVYCTAVADPTMLRSRQIAS